MYEGWLTIPEVVKSTGISERTLYRRMKDGSIHQGRRLIPNRKPLVVLNPEDIARLKDELLTPEPVAVEAKLVSGKPASPAKSAQTVSMPVVEERLAEILEALKATTVATRAKEKILLSLKEAALLSGLSREHLRSAILAKELPAGEAPSGRGVRYWIHQSALAQYCVRFGRVTEQRQVDSNSSVTQQLANLPS